MRFYKLSGPANIIVIHDELDLGTGKLKASKSAAANGVPQTA